MQKTLLIMFVRALKKRPNLHNTTAVRADENPRPVCPSTLISDDKIDDVRTMICEDCHLTVRETAEELGISVGFATKF